MTEQGKYDVVILGVHEIFGTKSETEYSHVICLWNINT